MNTNTGSIVSIIFSTLILVSCSPEHTELHRVMSPDGTHVAVVSRLQGGGAAGFQTYNMNVELADGEDRSTSTVLDATRCESMIPTWKGNATLVVTYDSHCFISSFKNYWLGPSKSGNPRILEPAVEIILDRAEGERRNGVTNPGSSLAPQR